MSLLEDSKRTISELRRTRGVVKASLTRVRTFIERFNPEEQALSLLEFRQEELPRICKKFEDVQSQLELIAEDAEKEDEERERFEAEYFSLRSMIQEIINAAKPQSTNEHNVSSRSAECNRAKLAPIALPTFSGDIKSWVPFFDVFRVMVHEVNEYSPAQKFMYLRSCLKGPAAELVQAIPISESNYKVVIERLEQRYDNPSMVIQAHIRELLNSPNIETPSAKTLQSLHAHVCTHVAALKALKQPVEQWDAWLVTIITSCMDHTTAHEWQLRRVDNKLPSYKELEKFLASRCIAFESAETCSQMSGGNQRECASSKKINVDKKSLMVTKGGRQCPQCSGSHLLSRCEKFKGATVSKRLAVVREAHLCFNCFSPAHNVEACKSAYTCFVCNQRHHTMLHFEKIQRATKGSPLSSSIEGQDETTHSGSASSSASASLMAVSNDDYVFLATALVRITDRNGFQQECRAVLHFKTAILVTSEIYI